MSWQPGVRSACSKLCFCTGCCNIANECFYLQYSLCNADVLTLLQAALAEQTLANQQLDTALTASQEERQADVVSVRHFSVPLLLLQALIADMQLSNAGSA